MYSMSKYSSIASHFVLAMSAAIMLAACSESINIEKRLEQKAEIYPDYEDVIIPPNIAPMNISVNLHGSARLLVEGGGKQLWIKDDHGSFNIPENKWHKLLEACKGGEIAFTVCEKVDGRWVAYKPYCMTVATDPIDSYVAYRLIPPDYELWNKMGIYQRNLESFEQTAIVENSQADYNCVNCHSFQAGSPSTFVFHSRETHPGTMVVRNGTIEKLNTKTDSTMSSLVYPHWHPDCKYIAFSVNATHQAFHANNKNRVEVYDEASDVVIYDVEKHEILSTDALMGNNAFETFPSFAADGKSLYFCSAKAVENMPADYQDVHYSLCCVGFNAENGTVNEKIDTLYNAAADSMSVSFPRESPNGKFLCFTRHKYGNFSIWHQEADLYMLNKTTNQIYPLEKANSERVESYHSWSSNSKWMIFSSRRDDGLYTRPYICYIDDEGQAHKAFMMPQKSPKDYYTALMLSYNIPELIKDEVKVNSKSIENVLKNKEEQKVTFRE